MGKQHRTVRLFSVLACAGMLALVSVSAACTDPVRDRAIERLGDEDPAVPPGPEHRVGQPCVLCHSEGGPASDFPFAIAGTIFETSDPESQGAADVDVLFVDANNAKQNFVTNAVGNFFVRESEWPDLAFPFKTGIRKPGGAALLMNTTINREGSCNFCHRPNPGSPLAIPGEDDPRESIGQIFAGTAPAAGVVK